MITDYILLTLVLTAVMALSVWKRKLTLPGALLGGGIGTAVYMGAAWKGVLLLGAFFTLGVLATGWKKQLKQSVAAGDGHPQRRNAAQVFANGGVAAIAGVLAFLFPAHAVLCQLLLAASLASATADTLSSELGMVYGKRFFNILSGKKDEKGLDGVISAEGTLIGAAGALLIALIYILPQWSLPALLIVTTAGILGNFADSLAGALWERKQLIGNNTVNFLNTMVAALFAWFLYHFSLSIG